MTIDDIERVRRVVRKEEQERVIGIIEFYSSILGDSTGEKNVKGILAILIKMLTYDT